MVGEEQWVGVGGGAVVSWLGQQWQEQGDAQRDEAGIGGESGHEGAAWGQTNFYVALFQARM